MKNAVAPRLGIRGSSPDGLLGGREIRKVRCYRYAALTDTTRIGLYSAASAARVASPAWNCSDSVEPVNAVVDEVPPMTVWLTRSK